jgi:hypothetical protein
MKKQTAVEWLVEQLPLGIRMNLAENGIDLAQAKAMEKQQQEETFKQSRLAKIFEKDMPPIWKNFEHYYTETFK